MAQEWKTKKSSLTAILLLMGVRLGYFVPQERRWLVPTIEAPSYGSDDDHQLISLERDRRTKGCAIRKPWQMFLKTRLSDIDRTLFWPLFDLGFYPSECND